MSLSPKLLSDSPRRQLPSWSRPCLTKRSLNVGKLSKDAPVSTHHSKDLTVPEPPSRVHQLEKNVIFLKQQHRETLQQLHEEIERLKNQNRELNFKMIMCTCGQVSRGRSTNSRGRRSGGRGHQEAERSRDGYNGEEEIRRLRNALGTEKNKNRHLISVIERKVLEYKKGSSDPSESELSTGETGSSSSTLRPGDQLFLSSRQPTIKECETVIKQLQHQNGQQTHELMQIKADLRDVLYSHKWTPDAFLLARAYVADDTTSSSEPSQSNSAENTTSLPEVPNKFQNVKIVERAYQRVKEEVTLPALKPKLPATVVAERHRRQQAIRTKLSRSVI